MTAPRTQMPGLLQCTHRYADGTSAWTPCSYNAAIGARITECRRCHKRVTC